jgi:hypothetical protein
MRKRARWRPSGAAAWSGVHDGRSAVRTERQRLTAVIPVLQQRRREVPAGRLRRILKLLEERLRRG